MNNSLISAGMNPDKLPATVGRFLAKSYAALASMTGGIVSANGCDCERRWHIPTLKSLTQWEASHVT